MAAVFQDTSRFTYINFLPSGTMVTMKYYSFILKGTCVIIQLQEEAVFVVKKIYDEKHYRSQ
jgi:hypothetical protein